MLLKEFPTCNKLVENFKRIRDNEWRSAFHDLEKHYKLSEEVITELLAGIARVSDLYCCFRPVLFRISRINCVIFFLFFILSATLKYLMHVDDIRVAFNRNLWHHIIFAGMYCTQSS